MELDSPLGFTLVDCEGSEMGQLGDESLTWVLRVPHPRRESGVAWVVSGDAIRC